MKPRTHANDLDQAANEFAEHAIERNTPGRDAARTLIDTIRTYRARANRAGQDEATTNQEIGWHLENAIAAAANPEPDPEEDEREPDYGGAFDGHTVSSDADPGL